MRAFLTGGTGFVGGHLAERLRAAGWEVRALAREGSNAEILEKAGCEIVRGGLDTERALRQGCAGADVVFHLAAITKAVSEGEFRRVNVDGTRRLLVAAREARFAGRFVLLSSLAAAGPARNNRPLTEDRRPRPVSAYGASKLAAERHVRSLGRRFEWTVLRPGAIYGPREHEIYEAVKLIEKVGLSLEVGDIRLQMTHVDDVVEALVRVAKAKREAVAGRAFFANDMRAWRYSGVIDEIGAALGRRVRHARIPLAGAWVFAGTLDLAGRVAGKPLSPLGRDKVREIAAGSWLADSSALSRATGWKPRTDFSDGIRKTIAWYRGNGWLD